MAIRFPIPKIFRGLVYGTVKCSIALTRMITFKYISTICLKMKSFVMANLYPDCIKKLILKFSRYLRKIGSECTVYYKTVGHKVNQ